MRQEVDVIGNDFDFSQGGSGVILPRMASYYLECISKDIDIGITENASGRHWDAKYVQLPFIPNDSDIGGISPNDPTRLNKLIDKIRQQRNNLVLKIGYPVFLKRSVSQRGDTFFSVEPVFLLGVDTDRLLGDNKLVYSDDRPDINPEIVKSTTDIQGADLLREIMFLKDELGLNSAGEKIDFGGLVARLIEVRQSWQWKEEINPLCLSDIGLNTTREQGIYNVCAAFVAERSKYTAGLEKELSDLKEVGENAYNRSILAKWINNNVQSSVFNTTPLLEPLPLNEEQREAVRRGLASDLTVITGPPGTGKSQVVTCLLVNAIYQGQKVLFASKNNKAVDVVCDRVNELTTRPFILRLRNNEFRAVLAGVLIDLLVDTANTIDLDHYQKAEAKHVELAESISRIKEKQLEMVKKINQVSELSRGLEGLRDHLGDHQIKLLYETDPLDVDGGQNRSEELKKRLRRTDRSSQSFLVRLLWKYLKDKRKKKFISAYDDFRDAYARIGLEFPLINETGSSAGVYDNIMHHANAWLSNIYMIKTYYQELGSLKELESLFQLSKKESELAAVIRENSTALLHSWINILPSKPSLDDNHTIGDFLDVLDLIVESDQYGQQVGRHQWGRYYRLLPQIIKVGWLCWAVTSLSARNRIPFQAGLFDLVVIDEASQCDIASALPLLFRAKKAVIIGDDQQLTHISSLTCREDTQLLKKYALERDFSGWSYSASSLFSLAASLCPPGAVVALKDHHRSHADIIGFSNKYFYQDTLRIATNYEKLNPLHNGRAVSWTQVMGKVTRPVIGGSLNEMEAKAVIQVLKQISTLSYSGTLGVVTPFRAQANRIRDLIYQDKALVAQLADRQLLVDTVHKFQGDERDLIVFSMVVGQGMSDGSQQFLARTRNLFNVAVTRARASLIIVGDMDACLGSRIDHIKRFAECVKSLGNSSSLQNDIKNKYGPQYPEAVGTHKVSVWEKVFYEALYKEGIITIPRYTVGQYILTLALINGEKRLNIEIDGETDHKTWDDEMLSRDHLRNMRLKELGWDVERFWIFQIRDDLNNSVKKVAEWMKG